MDMFSNTKLFLKNLPGKKTSRKIVVIHVDDYGSIRMKDKAAQEALRKAGFPISSRYSKFETLASTEDLEMLFEVLTSVKDSNGHYACFTPFANVANPDFEKIRESNFSQYYRQPFTETLKKYGPAYEGAYELWKQGISEDIFHPEYHGTEHICVRRYMKALREGNVSSLLAFDNECFSVGCLPTDKPVAYEPSVFNIEKLEDNEFLRQAIIDGVAIFKETLGYEPRQFTPGNGIHSPALHETLRENGIKYIDVQRFTKWPLGDGKYKKEFVYTGKENAFGQKYVIRNCVFEPYIDKGQRNEAAVRICMDNVAAAFKFHNPAIISTHRVNFVGELEKEHRNDSLQQLKSMLHEIVKRWPDVEFMNSSDMLEQIL